MEYSALEQTTVPHSDAMRDFFENWPSPNFNYKEKTSGVFSQRRKANKDLSPKTTSSFQCTVLALSRKLFVKNFPSLNFSVDFVRVGKVDVDRSHSS